MDRDRVLAHLLASQTPTQVTPIFWGFVALDAALLVILIILGIVDPGSSHDGGVEMSMIFFVIVPAIIVGAAVLLFVKTQSSAAHLVALIIAAGPALILGGTRVRSAIIDYQIHQNSLGSGYFSSRGSSVPPMPSCDTMSRPSRDRSKHRLLNTKGDGGNTLMELAVDGAYESPPSPASLDVIRELIARGADPSTGLETTKSPTVRFFACSSTQGAKTDYAKYKSPVVFTWLGVMPDAISRGAPRSRIGCQPRTREIGPTLIDAAAESDRWNFVLLLMDRGADCRHVRQGVSRSSFRAVRSRRATGPRR